MDASEVVWEGCSVREFRAAAMGRTATSLAGHQLPAGLGVPHGAVTNGVSCGYPQAVLGILVPVTAARP